MESNSVISIFNETEVRELNSILDFFTGQICNQEMPDVNSCFKEYLGNLFKDFDYGKEFELNISFEEQMKLYYEISDSTFNEIWSFERSPQRRSSDSIRYLQYNSKGKYFSFLKELATQYKHVKDYYATHQAAGDLSPSMAGNVLYNYDDYNYDDVRIRLFIAIHFLTLNDQMNREDQYSASFKGETHKIPIGSKWIRITDYGPDFDSLIFVSEQSVEYFSGDVGWHYGASYSINQDTIIISMKSTQFEMDDVSNMPIDFMRTLIIKDDTLTILSTKLLKEGKWSESKIKESHWYFTRVK
jgi:hypothetical protein